VALTPRELDVPGFKFHTMTGDRKGTFSVWICENWRITFKRITFKWSREGHPYDVDLEDYH
jgi:toxin HigB-1